MAEKETRVAVQSRSGQTVWLPKSQVAAFREGQKKLQRGEVPSGLEQRTSEIVSEMLAMSQRSEAPEK